MKIWLVRSSEPMPISKQNMRLMRMGMLAEELSKRGHEVIWFSNTFDHFKKEQLYNEDTIVDIKKNYKIYLLHANKYKKNISIARIINHKIIAKKFAKYARKLEKPDIIFTSMPTIDFADEAVKYGKKFNVPVIVDIRDLWPDIFYHNLPKSLSLIGSPYIKLLSIKTSKIMKDAFAITSISEDMLKWGLEKGQREKSMFDKYFYIGYDASNEKYNDKLKLVDKDKFNLAFFATINNQFDYLKIKKLAEKLFEKDENIVINICGDGPQFNLLLDLTKNLKNIKLFGWTDRDDLINIIHNSDMGLAPYKNTFDFQKSVSNKFAEYLSYGLPIILFSEGYMKKLIDENNCGIATSNMDEMVNYILLVKNNKNKYKEVSSNAKKLYNDRFVAKKIYKEFVDYFEKIREDLQK